MPKHPFDDIVREHERRQPPVPERHGPAWWLGNVLAFLITLVVATIVVGGALWLAVEVVKGFVGALGLT